ncbi:NUDIX domain-containing protein [Brumimicrobium salinarum]|uniref:NUDIX domain-containing protein n=1 Tax=Brumimicrobium salinarum TaxID=2058658 RepID=UPI0013FD17E5|nr:NUDIX hydrolase [Brumimicrobium salinarum]
MGIQQNIKLAADAVVFSYDKSGLYLLLVERKKAVNNKKWALPGGFIEDNESPEKAAIRELQEETGVKVEFLKQFYTFGKVKRDPRFRVVSIAHFIIMKKEGVVPIGNDDAAKAKWILLNELPTLAFDHGEVVQMAFDHLQQSISSLSIDCIKETPTLEDVKLITKHLKKAQRKIADLVEK